MPKIPIIIDCDTGTDDAIAIIEALYCPSFDVRAITTVAGNVPLTYTSQNTLNLVDYLGFQTKVSIGAAKPILGDLIRTADATHGSTGMGTIVLPPSKQSFYSKNAVETIVEEARTLNGELVLIPTGPMTNVAQAILAFPELTHLIKQIVFMGGAMIGGNETTSAEFNAWVDPEALSIVLNSGIPTKMIGLDVTEKAILDREDASKLRALDTRAGILSADLLEYMFIRFDGGGENALMHDGLAVAVAAQPELVSTRCFYVDCECRGTYTRGHTFVANNDVLVKKGSRPELCDVALDLDLPAYKQFVHTTIGNSKQ